MSENKKEEIKEEVVNETVTTEVKEETKKEEKKADKKAAQKEEIKNEATDAVKQVKEQMKDVNIKEEAKVAKGFVSELVKDPISKVEEIANDSTNKNFKTAIILTIVWAIANVVTSYSFKYFKLKNFLDCTLDLVKLLLGPVLVIVAMSAVIYFLSRKSENKKSLVTIMTTVTTTKLPLILAEVVSILTLISSQIGRITTRVTCIAEVVSAVLLFFAIKDLFGKKNEKDTLKTFVIVEAVYMLVSLVLTFLEIYIY